MECLLEQGLRLERTKVGAGEKEHAYVLKKHQYLQISACLFVCFVFMASIGFFYRYELLELAQQVLCLEIVRDCKVVVCGGWCPYDFALIWNLSHYTSPHDLSLVLQEKELFRFEKTTRQNEQSVENRLMRVSTALQAHLRRDKHEKDMMNVYFSRVKDSNQKHLETIKGLMAKNLEKKKFEGQLLKMVSNATSRSSSLHVDLLSAC